MRQVIAIHGGNSGFESYEDFIEALRAKVLDLHRENKVGWKKNLQGALGDGYEVLLPTMPNKENAKYLEWKIWFEKYIPHMQNGVVLIGHSLGGIFLAKYLSEESLPVEVAATFLVAAPYELGKRRHIEFALPESLSKFERQGGKIFLYQSKDDPVVQFAELAKYEVALPHATSRVFEDKQHFNMEEFPEIVADVTSLVLWK